MISKSHDLRKLIILFLLVIMPVIIISVIIINISNARLEEEVLNGVNQSLNDYMENLERELKYSQLDAALVAENSNVVKLSNMSDLLTTYEKSQLIGHFRETITSIRTNSPYLSNICVYIEPMNKGFNADGHVNGSVFDLDEGTYSRLVKLKNLTDAPVIFDQGRLIMLLSLPTDEPKALIEAQIDSNYLKDVFSGFNSNSSYIFQFDSGQVMTNIDDQDLLKLYLDQLSLGPTIKTEEGYMHLFTYDSRFLSGNYVLIMDDTQLFQPLRVSGQLTVFFFFMSFIAILLFFVFAIKLIHNPLSELVDGFEELQNGNFDYQIKHLADNEFSYLYQSYNEMTNRLSQMIDEVYKKNLLIQKAELKQLQAQINPHFLYNSFFMLQRMIQGGNQEEATEISKKLGTYFRYITKSSEDLVTLANEYEHAKIYMDIQAMRFTGRIRINSDSLPHDFEEFMVPKLIIQPIIENAFNHGLENKESDGQLYVKFLVDGNELYKTLQIIIEDNGDMNIQKLNELKEQLISINQSTYVEELTGLLNIYKRIQIFYKEEGNLELDISKFGGLRVTISLKHNLINRA